MRAITSLRDLEDTYAAQTVFLGGQGGEVESLWDTDPDHASWVEGVEKGTITEP